MRAVSTFFVNYAGIRLKVRLFLTAQDVYCEDTGKSKWRGVRSELPMGFFKADASGKTTGTIVLAVNQDLADIIPHEVFHAILHKRQMVHTDDDESFAYALGILSARIHKKIKQRFFV